MLVTGANGFVGRALCAEAVSRGMAVRGITRASGYLPISVEKFAVDGIDGNTDWQDVLTGCEVVVHLAARVHVMAYTSANPLEAFRRVNVQGTLNLARQAAAVGVRRFVFVSSIKVNGEATQPGCPFTADDAPAPLDAYAQHPSGMVVGRCVLFVYATHFHDQSPHELGLSAHRTGL